MKKTILVTMVLLLSIMVILPASASNGQASEGGWWKTKFAEVRGKHKQHNKDKFKEYVRPQFGQKEDAKVLRGKITALGSDYVVVKTEVVDPQREVKHPEKMAEPGEYTIKIDEDTKIVRKLWGESKLSEFSVDDTVHVVMKADHGSYVAYLLKDQSTFMNKHSRKAEVTNVNTEDNTLTIQRGKKSATVTVDAETKINVEGKDNATISDIKTGDKVAVKGIVNKNLKTIFADIISVFTGQWNSWTK